jgi:oligopeptide/dipeptide ABC transporter ATP-binding protein
MAQNMTHSNFSVSQNHHATAEPAGSEILRITDLKTYFYGRRGVAKAVDGVSLHVKRGETFGVVGESGCGKSITALSILRLVPVPMGRIVSGQIEFEGRDLLKVSETEMRRIRGNEISMIFQEPMTSLNPVYTVGDQIAEAIMLHQNASKKQAREQSISLLKMVGIPAAERRFNDYPHQMSGGMRQRAMIAMALSCRPNLLIADEPTTALDVTIQAQILDIIMDLNDKLDMSTILITHNLGIIAGMARRVAVMYAGRIVEEGLVDQIFNNPLHPYTQGLLKSIPRVDVDYNRETHSLHEIPGVVPSLLRLPPGCTFFPRCPRRMSICAQERANMVQVENKHYVSCWIETNGK